MFKTLVVALDLEEGGDRALPVVHALAAHGHARVDLVTVSSPGLSTAPDAFELGRRARRWGWDRDSWTVIHDVDAADGILQHAARLEDPLIVMATDAHSPWSATMFGSVPGHVLRGTNHPVLLIGPRVPSSWAPARTTLLACVDSHGADRLIAPIVSWQQTVTASSPLLAEVTSTVASQAPARRRLDDLRALLAAQGVSADVELLSGADPVSALQPRADRLDGAVYVATSARYTDGRLHWHSTTRELISRGGHPVLVVPARPASIPLSAPMAVDEHVAFDDRSIPPVLASVAGLRSGTTSW